MKKNVMSAFILAAGLLSSLVFSSLKAQTACKGSLIINEISNGVNGNKEFVELIATTCGTCSDVETKVDISNWIIDDNNGIFTSTASIASANLGISAGHLRLTNDSLWKNFTNGKLLVLFNATDFDSTNTDFLSASSQNFFVNANGSIFVAVGNSNLVERKSNTPIVGSPSSSNYCNNTLYGFNTSAWSTIGLRNSKLGDGIQIRCPGCNPGEPSFYHGISYGDTTQHVTNSNALFFDGAHVSFPLIDTIGGTGRAFHFFTGTNPGLDANWEFISASLATPGAANTPDNLTYITNVIDRGIAFNCCATPTVEPSTNEKGVLIVTEISNGPVGSCEYAELLVAACNGSLSDSVDIRGWIIDDNSGNFNNSRTCGSGVGITSGHLRLANNNCWKKIPVGSVIVLFNAGDNCYNFVDDACDSNNDGVYYIAVGTNTNIQQASSRPSTSICFYCPSSYTTANSWSNVIGLGNTADAFQVRCPGCTLENPNVEPTFYHGIGYGSGFSGFAASGSNLGGAYVSGSGSGKKYEFFQGTAPGLNVNWRALTANPAGTPPASVGSVFAFRDSVKAGVYRFPCCGSDATGGRMASQLTSEVNADVVLNAVSLFPNPTSGIVNLNINRSSRFTIQLINVMGKIVYTKTHEATNGYELIQLQLSELPTGVYAYTINSLLGEETVKGKLVIERN